MMTKQELIETFYRNHQEMIDYMSSLNEEQFTRSSGEKWTAGQQLQHVYLVISLFPKILSSKDFVLQKFGKIDRPIWSYDTVLENYFKSSRKATQPFLPGKVSPEQKATIAADTQNVLQAIRHLLEQYSDEELDTLVLPNPLLGKMTIRETFYLMGYHATHHLDQTVQNLELLKN